MNQQDTGPLVSIGLPSYNRPDGLKRALEQAVKQTYRNLEIIVSDNCSPDEESIKNVLAPFMEKDKRIKYFRHDENRGAFFNFKYLLEKATGEYFMWIADDDERHEKCIEISLQLIGNAGGFFGAYNVKNRFHDIIIPNRVPTITENMPLHKRMFSFISFFPTVYIYGLYKRECLGFFLKEDLPFDYLDGYFTMYVLANYGLTVYPTEYAITTLGINEESYVPKPFQKSDKRMFLYSPVIKKCSPLIWNNKQLNLFHKIFLLLYFRLAMLKQYITFEHPYKWPAWILNYGVRLPSRYIYRLIKRIRK